LHKEGKIFALMLQVLWRQALSQSLKERQL